MKNQASVHKYFAAANGYRGFRSNFNSIFDPLKFEKLYVLKGGPGTGKSSMMKKFLSALQKDGLFVEEIYCSSDPNSLDGIIAECNDKKIGILDGTAPHEMDTLFPGAIDSIINLGSNWDEKWLKAEKEKIIDINIEKKKAYKTAYHYLSLCGACSDRLYSLVNKTEMRKVLQSVRKGRAEFKIRHGKINKTNKILSSFGKQGTFSLLPLNHDFCNVYSPSCDNITGAMLITDLAEMYVDSGYEITAFSDPLDKEKIETIYLPELNITYSVSGGESLEFDSSNLFSISDNERLRVCKRVYNDCLSEAQRWFSIASDLHFRLEDIYSKTMDFEKNDLIFNQKYAEIMDILS